MQAERICCSRCRSPGSSGGGGFVSPACQQQPAVEEALCGALAGVYDVSLPHIASFFHQEALKQQDEVEVMLGFLAERGGNYCGKDVQEPGCEAVCSALPALELLLLQLKEEVTVLAELSQLAREHRDPHTASVVKSCFLGPQLERLKLLGDLLTNTRRVGCTSEQGGRLGEYILNELQAELSR